MSWGDWVGGIATGGLYNAGKYAYNGLKAPEPPGVGPAPDPSRLVAHPDGTYSDPVPGTRYQDRWGTTPFQAPNLEAQGANSAAQANNFIARMAEQDKRSENAYNGQNELADSLKTTIRNPSAPSVAQSQLNQTIGNIDRDVLSNTTARSGGANMATGARDAASLIAQSQLTAAGQGAALRAQEVTNAQQGLAGVYNNMAGNANTANAQNITGAEGFNKDALAAEMAREQAAQNAKLANQNMVMGFLTGGMAQGSNLINGSKSEEDNSGSGGGVGKYAGLAALA